MPPLYTGECTNPSCGARLVKTTTYTAPSVQVRCWKCKKESPCFFDLTTNQDWNE